MSPAIDEYIRLTEARDEWWRRACELSERVGFLEAALQGVAEDTCNAGAMWDAYQRQYQPGHLQTLRT